MPSEEWKGLGRGKERESRRIGGKEIEVGK